MRLKIIFPHRVNHVLSQCISWGHWFTLFNIFIIIVLGSNYLVIADWPSTFIGRFYAIISSIGQFSFLCFAVYLITLFPLSFMIRSPRFILTIGAIIATIGIMLLLVDIEIFSRFKMHLNFTIWEILTTSVDNTLVGQWQKLFVFVPIIFLIEILFSLWSWKKLRSITKRQHFAKPVVGLLIICFLSSHLIHIWADAHFYRPITMQRSSLPLSYPMTARHFLEKYGFITIKNQKTYSPKDSLFSMAIEYPLGLINYKQVEKPYNLLLVTIDNMAITSVAEMPYLSKFANDHIRFSHHYSASNKANLSLFSLFYGIDANYYDSIMASSTVSVLLDTILKQQYNLSFFSTDAFKPSIYQDALLADFSMPTPRKRSNQETTDSWFAWFNNLNVTSNIAPWFSFINYQIADKNTVLSNKKTLSLQAYNKSIKNIDVQIEQVIKQLEVKGLLKNTVVIITANKGLKTSTNQISLVNLVNDFDRDLLQVPLFIAWPNKVAKEVVLPTTHTDIMRTLMESLLQVTTEPSKYTQGLNLFDLPKKRDWIIVANEENMAALYQDKVIIIDNGGHYVIYDNAHDKLSNEKLNLATFLELLTNNRRFMVTN